MVPVSEPSQKVVPVFEPGKRSCQYLIFTLKVVPLYDVNPNLNDRNFKFDHKNYLFSGFIKVSLNRRIKIGLSPRKEGIIIRKNFRWGVEIVRMMRLTKNFNHLFLHLVLGNRTVTGNPRETHKIRRRSRPREIISNDTQKATLSLAISSPISFSRSEKKWRSGAPLQRTKRVHPSPRRTATITTYLKILLPHAHRSLLPFSSPRRKRETKAPKLSACFSPSCAPSQFSAQNVRSLLSPSAFPRPARASHRLLA